MRVDKVNGLTLDIWDSTAEIPESRFSAFNLYYMMDADIGGDMESVHNHIIRMSHYVEKGNMKHLTQELENYATNLQFIIQNISPKFLAFTALIKSVNGIEIDDITPEGAERLRRQLGGVKHGFVQEVIDAFKKKSDEELTTFHPKLGGGGKARDYHILLKKRTMIVLKGVEQGKQDEKALREIDGEMIDLMPPKKFFGSDGVEVKHQRQFEQTCLVISQHLNVDAKRMTTLAFHEALDLLENQK